VQAIEKDRTRIVDVEMPETNENSLIQNQAGPAQNISGPTTEDSCHLPAESKISRFVTIMQGCDNFCSYCVVPYVRGRETSIHPEKIIHEAEACVKAGAREIVLLGQNVNSYGKKEGLCSFAELLDRISGINGLERIRFVTSHPKDLSDELIEAFARIDKLCNHIHLPVQSGANAVLKRMNRKYSRETYMERINALRSVRPGIAITSDFIVGFPGESQNDFEMTLDLLETVRFDTLFAFEYSDRDLAPSRKFDGKVDEKEKHDRLRHLLDRQAKITRQIYDGLVGTSMKVLVEGLSKHGQQTDADGRPGDTEMTGRSSENRIVNFIINDQALSFEPESLVGNIVEVVIEKACANSLKARMPSSGASFAQAVSKGGKIHAA
jgi:tRNA-2-methylthio-N6-dimethylallyladenosine synthase